MIFLNRKGSDEAADTGATTESGSASSIAMEEEEAKTHLGAESEMAPEGIAMGEKEPEAVETEPPEVDDSENMPTEWQEPDIASLFKGKKGDEEKEAEPESNSEAADPETESLRKRFSELRADGNTILIAVPLDFLPLRDTPGYDGEVLKEIQFGTYLIWDGTKEVAKNRDFYYVTVLDTGETGFVDSTYVPPVDYLCSPKDDLDIVDVSSALYSYEDMMEDIDILCERYGDILKKKSLGKSLCGRDIEMVILGNADASHKVMVQSGIHGREYITVQLTMKLVEYYAYYYNKADFNGTPYYELFDNLAFYIIPMSNPDGVSISQFGESAVPEEFRQYLREAYESDKETFVYTKDTNDEYAWYDNYKNTIGRSNILNDEPIPYDEYLRLWKANAEAVDINVNFDAGWYDLDVKDYLSCSYYRGPAPDSEPETNILCEAATSEDFDCYISYHARGQLIYYDAAGTRKETADKSKLLADIISYVNRNILVEAKSQDTLNLAGFGDWVQLVLDKPGNTVEVGKFTCPTDIKEFPAIFCRNRESWAALAASF